MNLTTYANADGFLSASLDALSKEEEKNNLMISIAMRVRDGRPYGKDAPLFLTIHEQGKMVAAAIQTPPYPIILHCEPGHLEALEMIADHLIEMEHPLPGANGTVDVVYPFVEVWARRTGVATSPSMSLRIYALTEVTVPKDVAGQVRWAQIEDVPLLSQWFLAFHQEAVPDDPPGDPAASVQRFIEMGKLAVWDDGKAVSMAGSSRGTPHGATVSAVYTPPEYRARGYASACVATLSQALLDEGHHFCTLYTDLSNPTSNKIYQNVGYRPVVDCATIQFLQSKG